MSDFYRYFKENMDALGLPAPAPAPEHCRLAATQR